VIGLCEATEHLLAAGFAPRRTVVLMFGHDEEVSGYAGAAKIAAWAATHLASCGRSAPGGKPFAFILDEGLFVISDAFPGIQHRTAIVCVAEKGFVNVELRVRQAPGHASNPPAHTAIGVLARAITRLEANPFPAHLETRGPVHELFAAVAPSLPAGLRAVFRNGWLFGPILRRVLLAQPGTAAMVRTTTAVTLASGGTKANVLPSEARAVVNHRIHPSENVAEVLRRDAAVIDDARVELTARTGTVEPSPVSSHTCAAFHLIRAAVLDIYDRTIVAPGLLVGNTDTRHYWALAAQLYRHCPIELSKAETAMFHGVDERIGIDTLARLCAFYARVVSDAGRALEL
jgi:carboxypeptidase PM20D1